MYTVKEAAAILQISPHTIRYYTNCNLTPKLNRDKNGVRLFDEIDITYLQIAIYLRNCGMPIRTIQKYFSLSEKGDSTIPERYQMLLEQQDKLNQQLQQLLQSKEYISNKLKIYSEYMDGVQGKTHNAKKE